jgi:hypothetical protein
MGSLRGCLAGSASNPSTPPSPALARPLTRPAMTVLGTHRDYFDLNQSQGRNGPLDANYATSPWGLEGLAAELIKGRCEMRRRRSDVDDALRHLPALRAFPQERFGMIVAVRSISLICSPDAGRPLSPLDSRHGRRDCWVPRFRRIA